MPAATKGVNGHADTIPLGLYLWQRIRQIGVSHIFGVPGDFNLTLLDYIYDVEGLEWVGNTNELNAAYAADGYARTKHGAGCFVTTHGVGELSALNGVAGSMTEQIKTIHVVGQTSRAMQKNRMLIHHSIGPDPDHQIFNKASKDFRVAAAELQSEQGAPEEIDRVLRECFIKSCPVYIFVPIDLVDAKVPASALEKPIDLSPPVDEQAVQQAAEATLSAIYEAKNPAILVDCLVDRYDANAEVRALVEKLPFPIYSTNMSKGIIDESHPHYIGLFNGVPSAVGVASAIQGSDLVLLIGDMPSDTNSGGFTRKIPEERTIHLNPHTTIIQKTKTFTQVPLKSILTTLTTTIDSTKLPQPTFPKLPPRPTEDDINADHITQSWLWPTLATTLKSNDIILGETGTASFGLPDATFPPNVQWITQTYYGSIGFATPAAFGVEIAQKALHASGARKERGRTVLVTGDGSMMLTVQEIANMIKHQTCPLIFIINNAGYTIERVIHGATQTYNDIPAFNYRAMLTFMGLPHKQAEQSFHRAETKADLEAILQRKAVRDPVGVGLGPQVVEIIVDRMDVPWRLATQIATRGPEAVREMKEAGFKVRDMVHGEGFWA